MLQHSQYYQELKQSVIKCELLIDRLIIKVTRYP